MAEENIILRSVNNPPLTTKGTRLTFAELDGNFIEIYNSLYAQRVTSYVEDWDVDTVYDASVLNYAVYDGIIWKYIYESQSAGVTPGTDDDYWEKKYAADLAHIRDHDTFLDYGGDNQVSAQEIKELLDVDRVQQYIVLVDNGSPQHKWKVQVDATGTLYTTDLGEY